MYKISFFFCDIPITGYSDSEWENLKVVNQSIINKVNYKIIDIPYMPAKNMTVDILSFNDFFDFSKNEYEWLDDCNNIFDIDNLMMNPNFIEIWLK